MKVHVSDVTFSQYSNLTKWTRTANLALPASPNLKKGKRPGNEVGLLTIFSCVVHLMCSLNEFMAGRRGWGWLIWGGEASNCTCLRRTYGSQ